uniref:Uncharacterized protein n=1 Tax=Anguilla anguilla TaxID=7936 RepID=A0A0E9TTK2_ANGAN
MLLDRKKKAIVAHFIRGIARMHYSTHIH